jgi:hypothetical protein
MDEIVIASVRVDDHDLLEPVARDLAAGAFEQADGEVGFDADATGVLPRFQDLCEDKIREHNGRFKLRGTVAYFAADEHIRAEGHMVPVPLDAG